MVVLFVMKTELCQAVVVVRMLITIFLPKKLQRDMLALHLLLKIWKKGFECFKTLVAICRIAALETVLKNGIVQPDKFIKAQAVSADLVPPCSCRLYRQPCGWRLHSSLIEEVV